MQVLNLKKSYPYTCPCGESYNEVSPSIFMQSFQMNTGRVFCKKCMTGYFVKLNDMNDTLIKVEEPEHSGGLPDACYVEVGPFDMCINPEHCKLLGDECKGSCQLYTGRNEELE